MSMRIGIDRVGAWLLMLALAVAGIACSDDSIPEAPPPPAAEQPTSAEGSTEVSQKEAVVKVYAGPNIDWAVSATVETSSGIEILARLPARDAGSQTVWLYVALADGQEGWVDAGRLGVSADDLADLPVVEPQQLSLRTRNEAVVYALPGAQAGGDEIGEVEALLEGRSADGEWVLAHSAIGNDQRFRGWIHHSALETDPVVDELPIVLAPGLWIVPVESIQPAVNVLSQVEQDSWGLNGKDASIVFIEDADRWDAVPGQVKRLSLQDGATSVLLDAFDGRLLASPADGSVLLLPQGNPDASLQQVSIVDSSGTQVVIGELHTVCYCDVPPAMSELAQWSKDGTTLLLIDRMEPSSLGAAEAPISLYLINEERSVALGRGLNPVFHPDGQSIYVIRDQMLRRVDLTGADWPGFMPFMVEWEFQLSAAGDRIAVAGPASDFGELIRTDQGGPIESDSETVADSVSVTSVQWSTHGTHVAFRVDRNWIIGRVSERGFEPVSRIGGQSEVLMDLKWSHSGRYLTVTALPNWQEPLASIPPGFIQLRIYRVDGDFVTAFRAATCGQIVWLPDSDQLAVAAPRCSGA